MKFTVSRDELAAAVAHAACGIPSSPLNPAFARMNITADHDLLFRGSDGDVVFTSWLRTGADDPGSVTVPGKLFADWVQSLPPGTATFETNGAVARIACGKPVFTLPLQAGEYPSEPPPADAASIIPGKLFADALKRVLPATGRTDPALSAVRLIAGNGKLTAIATDKFRLAAASCPAGGEESCLLPGWSAERICRNLGEEVALGADSRVVTVSSGNSRVTSRVIAGEWPKGWEKLLDLTAGSAELEVDALAASLKRARLAVEADRPVILTFTKGNLHVEAGYGNHFDDNLDISYDGENFEALFGIQYLLDGVNACEGTLRMGFTAPLAPVCLQSGEFRYVILPRRKI